MSSRDNKRMQEQFGQKVLQKGLMTRLENMGQNYFSRSPDTDYVMEAKYDKYSFRR